MARLVRRSNVYVINEWSGGAALKVSDHVATNTSKPADPRLHIGAGTRATGRCDIAIGRPRDHAGQIRDAEIDERAFGNLADRDLHGCTLPAMIRPTIYSGYPRRNRMARTGQDWTSQARVGPNQVSDSSNKRRVPDEYPMKRVCNGLQWSQRVTSGHSRPALFPQNPRYWF